MVPTATDEPAPAGAADAEAAAWADVEARWGEAEAHRAYLARFTDLDGLGAAGRRYRAVLAARPDDAMALAMKAEILKRATVLGLASLPRTAPSRLPAGRWKRYALLLTLAWLGLTAGVLLWRAFSG